MKQPFGDWLQAELDKREWGQADLARKMGKATGVISNLVNNKRQQPAVESCKLIAKAFDLPLEEVYRAAGILPETPEPSEVAASLVYVLQDLPDVDQHEVLKFAEFRRKLWRSQNN